MGALSVRREDNECLRRSLAPTSPKLTEQSLCPPPHRAYYLFKGSGAGAKLLESFHSIFLPADGGTGNSLHVLALMIQLLYFASSRPLFPVLFHGSTAFISPTPCRPLASSHFITVSAPFTRLSGRGCETGR